MIKCSSCGKEYENFASYCNACDIPLSGAGGEPVGSEPSEKNNTAALEQSLNIAKRIHKILFVLYFLIALLFLVFGLINLDSLPSFSKMAVLFSLPLGLGYLHYQIHNGLNQKKKWARNASIGVGLFLLLGFPIGTILGAILLGCMLKTGWDDVLE